MAGVKFLTYNNKKYPIKLGLYTMMLVQEEHGIVVGDKGLENEDGSNLAASQYMPLLFHALQQGHRLTKRNLTLEMEDMHDMLNDCFLEFVSLIPEFFPDNEDMLEKIKGGEKGGKQESGGKEKQITQGSSAKQSAPSKSVQKKSANSARKKSTGQ